MPTLRLVFLGTGDFAVPSFERLATTAHELVALITQPDRPQGRKQELVPSRIKRAAEARRIPVEQPEDINAPEGVALVQAFRPDLLVTAAYGQILSAELLAVPNLGGINLHGSVLPAYRGAAPVARAIQHGETSTGVTVIRMVPRIDAGGVIAVARTEIGPDETAGELEARLAMLGAPLVVQCVEALAAGPVPVLPQDPAKVTRAPKLRKEDGAIDWSRPAQAIHNLVRAMQPWPTAFTHWHARWPAAGDGGQRQPPPRLILHQTSVLDDLSGPPGEVVEADGENLIVAAGAGAVAVRTLQFPGKRTLSAAEFLRGRGVQKGDRMGPPA